MRILHVSIFDRLGGACIAAYRQHTALRRAGVDSKMLVKGKVTNDNEVSAYRPTGDIPRRAKRFLRRKTLAHQASSADMITEFFDDRTEYGGDESSSIRDYDVVNLQFSQGFLDHPSFYKNLPSDIPLVVTMHEMSCFTGGCAYTGSCNRFHHACGDCPQLRNNGENDFSRKGWERRQQAYASRRPGKLHFVADSHWIAEQAKSSSLLRDYPVSVIHYGVDTDIYRPLDRTTIRESLGIPKEAHVIAFAAVSVHNKRKGMHHLLEALESMPDAPFLLTWGGKTPPALKSESHLHLGDIDSEHLMAMAYNAADLFVMPSLEEAFGQTALESLSCGIPVVAFEVGGIPDMIKPSTNGILVPSGDSTALAEGISSLLKDESARMAMSAKARKTAISEFSMAKNASLYRELYSELLEN